MNCAWDWLQNAVNVLAMPTFLLLIWQVLRAEGMEPPISIGVGIDLLDADAVVKSSPVPVWAVSCAVTCESPGALYDVRCEPINERVEMGPGAGFASCLMHGGAPVVSRFVAPVGTTMRVLVQWRRLTPLLNRPVAQAVIVEIAPPLRQTGLARSGIECVWHWAWFAGLRRCLNGLLDHTPIRTRFRLGRFRSPRNWWKSNLPDDTLLH